MTGAQLRRALRAGQPIISTLIVSESPRWPAMVQAAGFDMAFIDTEHVALDRRSVAWMCQVYAALGIPPVVRIPSPDPYAACMALDGGAVGVIAPYIETVEQVRAMRGATRLRPLKGRRLAETLAGGPLEPQLASYLETFNANNVFIANIESVPAMENLDALLAEDAIDAVLIGPHDLSTSLGVPEQYSHPTFTAAVERILRTARAAGVGAGMHMTWADEPGPLLTLAEQGCNLLVYRADILALRAMRTDVAAIRQAVGATDAGAAKEDHI